MKKLVVSLVCLAVLFGVALAAEVKDPYNIQVKKLYSAPDENSNLLFEVPVEVKLLDMSADNNWYKVKIAFKMGPFSYTYIGWTQIPVGQIMAEREKASELAKVPSPVLEEPVAEQ